MNIQSPYVLRKKVQEYTARFAAKKMQPFDQKSAGRLTGTINSAVTVYNEQGKPDAIITAENRHLVLGFLCLTSAQTLERISSKSLSEANLYALQNVIFDWNENAHRWDTRSTLHDELQWVVTEARWVLEQTKGTGQALGFYVGLREQTVMPLADTEPEGVESFVRAAIDKGGTVINLADIAAQWEYQQADFDDGDSLASSKAMSEFFSSDTYDEIDPANSRPVREMLLFSTGFKMGMAWAQYKTIAQGHRHLLVGPAQPAQAERKFIKPPQAVATETDNAGLPEQVDEYGFPL